MWYRYPIGKVVGVEVYKQDVVVIREDIPKRQPCETPRGEISRFSRKSRMRLAFTAINTEVEFRTMITLTYPKEFPCDGAEVKAHLHRFLIWLRRDTGNCSILWFLEFQRRGAPHVHILCDYPLPRDRNALKNIRFRVASTWYRIVASNDPKHLSAGTRVERIRKPDGARRYTVKYAFKMQQKAVPPTYRNVGRFWGCTRDVPPKPEQYIRCTEDDIRGVLNDWEFAPQEERLLYRVLYGRAQSFRDTQSS